MNVFQRLKVAVRAFRETYVTSDLLDPQVFEDVDSRRLRYQILWAWYESTAFRDIHNWAKAYRKKYALYKAVRNIYNPAYRLVEFWKMMIYGGLLDIDAREEGAIPIRTMETATREGIAQLWRDSDWARDKDLLTTYGCALGDAAIRIVDDVEREEVRMEIVHPSTLKNISIDGRGDVIYYEIEETRVLEGNEATYLEKVELISEGVHFETFRDKVPYGWNGQPAEWIEDYPAVPLFPVQHNYVGMLWGWAEMHPARSKFHEIEDVASKLHDYIRKVIDPVWLFNFREPRSSADVQVEYSSPTTDNPAPEREEIPSLYVPDPRAQGQPLVTDMIEIEQVAGEIQNLIEEMERDFPELRMDVWSTSNYTTGKALRTARQYVERKVITRRPNYDTVLTKAHRLALVMGAMRQYEGYEGVATKLESRSLDHSIPTDRTIFETDEKEEIDKKGKFWEVFVTTVNNGMPPELVLRDFGWSEDRISEFLSSWTPPAPDEGETPEGEQNEEQDLERPESA